jgi:hypothetical protein
MEELEAEKWSFDVMRKEGVPIPHKSVRRAKSYVTHKIRQAARRGANRIDSEAAKFAGVKVGSPRARPPAAPSARPALTSLAQAALAIVLAAPPARSGGRSTSSAFIPRPLIDELAARLVLGRPVDQDP